MASWPMRIAKKSGAISEFICSSDDPDLLKVAESEGYRPLLRPPELATDAAQGCDVLRHAIRNAGVPIQELEMVVLQHANSATYTPIELQAAIEALRNTPEADAIIPGHVVQDYHPYRLRLLKENSFAESFFPGLKSISSNRQDLPTAVAFNHTFWVIRTKAALSNAGQPPWECMGERVKVALTNERRFDVHSIEDIRNTELWIQKNLIPVLEDVGS